jgi:hypothetical protein
MVTTRNFVPLLLAGCTGLCLALQSSLIDAYPLDGYESTGIGRLEAQRLVQEGKKPGKKRPSGELLPLSKVNLRLLDQPDFHLPKADPALTEQVKKMLGSEVDRYGIALLDLSDPDHPRYAEWNGNQHQNPGSVGKILVALGIFQALADIYPDDIEARRRVLREAMITADDFSKYDHHTVRLSITARPTRFHRKKRRAFSGRHHARSWEKSLQRRYSPRLPATVSILA